MLFHISSFANPEKLFNDLCDFVTHEINSKGLDKDNVCVTIGVVEAAYCEPLKDEQLKFDWY